MDYMMTIGDMDFLWWWQVLVVFSGGEKGVLWKEVPLVVNLHATIVAKLTFTMT